jgi:dUTP pyrophosphatase
MAGKFGAFCSRAAASLFTPRGRLLSSAPTPPQFLAFSHRLSTIAMAASNGAAAADSIQEPPQKISKIAPLLKVKKLSDKAVLPSRGSALAAGYDLSRYAFFRRANFQDALCSRLPDVDMWFDGLFVL